MTVQGGVIETKPIGLPISTGGTFNRTELVDGKIQLAKNSNGLMYEEGEWISDVVDIQDNFESFGKLFVTHNNNGASDIVVLTRTSDDGVKFDKWEVVNVDGSILSTKRRYISVKIVFYGGYGNVDIRISSVKLAANNEFVEDLNNFIALKREYEFDMTNDTSWLEEGSLYRKYITRNEWLRIDKMNVL